MSVGAGLFLCPIQHPNCQLFVAYCLFRALIRMNRESLKQHLDLAEKHIAEGVVHVEQERQIVEELKRRRQDFRRSADLLDLFKETLATHITERDRLLEALAERS